LDCKEIEVTGPLGDLIKTNLYTNNNNMCVIELAKICGLNQVPLDKRDPYNTTSKGLGEVIKLCLSMNIKNILIGLGGTH
jgi:glycerate 2-kinase